MVNFPGVLEAGKVNGSYSSSEWDILFIYFVIWVYVFVIEELMRCRNLRYTGKHVELNNSSSGLVVDF